MPLASFINNPNVNREHNFSKLLHMQHFFTLSSTYHGIEVGLFTDFQCRQTVMLDKTEASSLLIPTLDALLETHNLCFQHLSFIAVNQGPGPFTTLRVVIATVNGLSFSTQIPLIPINGLETLLIESRDNKRTTIALLNAFAQDVYYGILSPQGDTIDMGCNNIHTLLTDLKNRYGNEPVHFVGNAVELYKKELEALFDFISLDEHGECCLGALVRPEFLQMPTLNTIARRALERFHEGDKGVSQVIPLYLKEFSAVMKF